MIKVLDALPGTGKTTYIIEELKRIKGPFVYVTPLLSEVERIQKEVPDTISPYGIKREVFKELLARGSNIATTHSLFLQLESAKVPAYYTLVIDEALDCIAQYSISKGRFREMFNGGTLKADETGKIYFLADIDEYDPKKDTEVFIVYAACINSCAYKFGDNIIIVELSPEIMQQFKYVYILTYSFEGSVFAHWLQYHNMEYQYITPVLNKMNNEVKAKLKELITLEQPKSISSLEYTYSYSNWETGIDYKKLKSKLISFFTNNRYSSKDILITCPKEQFQKIKGKGYTKDTWLSSRTKATNDYSHKTIVVYLYNKWYNPFIKRFCNERGIPLDEDNYAITELIQFIFRSAIRKGGPIRLILPSDRMRVLFERWLNEN